MLLAETLLGPSTRDCCQLKIKLVKSDGIGRLQPIRAELFIPLYTNQTRNKTA